MYEKSRSATCAVPSNKEHSVSLGLLDLLVSHLNFTVDDEGWEPRYKVGALPLSTVNERVVHVLLLQVILLLGAPWARVGAVHGDTSALWWLVHGWCCWQTARVWSTWVGDVRALGAQPPLVNVKAENTDDDSECHAHNDGVTIHIYLYTGKENLQRCRIPCVLCLL